MKNVCPGHEDSISITPADRKRALSAMKRSEFMAPLSASFARMKRSIAVATVSGQRGDRQQNDIRHALNRHHRAKANELSRGDIS